MAQLDPKTEDEAISFGLKKATKEEWEQYLKHIPHELTARIPLVDCHRAPPGTKCLEGPCIGGVKGISFCGVDRECTFYDPVHPGYLVRC